MSQQPGNGRSTAAIGAGVAASVVTLVTTLGSQPWYVTVSLMTAITVIAVVYMITSAWGERPAPRAPSTPLDFAAVVAALRSEGSDPYAFGRSVPPPHGGDDLNSTVPERPYQK